jgi:hypothetical protein
MPLSVKMFALMFLIPFAASATPSESFIKLNAIRIAREQLPPVLLSRLSKTKLLMIGEMHGTNESPKLIERFVRLFTKAGKTVLVGLEIPSGEQALIDQFLSTGDSSLLKRSPFFNAKFQDGRESIAIANLLIALRGIEGVRIVCFDISDNRKERDLGMASNFVNARERLKPDVAITLSGNCHSKLSNNQVCTPGEDPMGMDILKLSGDLSPESVTSLNVRYESGASWSAMADFIGVHEWPKVFTPYTTAVSWNSYFLSEPPLTDDGYNAAFFFRSVSASLPYASASTPSSSQ